jgi:hypothetical protein
MRGSGGFLLFKDWVTEHATEGRWAAIWSAMTALTAMSITQNWRKGRSERRMLRSQLPLSL